MPLVPIQPLLQGLDIVGAMESGERSDAQRRRLKLEEERERRAQRMGDLQFKILQRQEERKRAGELAASPEEAEKFIQRGTKVVPPQETSLAEQTEALGLAEGAPDLQQIVPGDVELTQRAPDQTLAGPPSPESITPNAVLGLDPAKAEAAGTTPELFAAERRRLAEQKAAKRAQMTAKFAERLSREPRNRQEALLNSPSFQERIKRGIIDPIDLDNLDAHIAAGEVEGLLEFRQPVSPEGEQVADFVGLENLNTPAGRAEVKALVDMKKQADSAARTGKTVDTEIRFFEKWDGSKEQIAMNDLASRTNALLNLDPANPAAQYQAVVDFAKILDPGSVVREGEVKAVKEILGLWEKLGLTVDDVVGQKKILKPAQIKQLQDAAKKITAEYHKDIYMKAGERRRKLLGSYNTQDGKPMFDGERAIPFTQYGGKVGALLGTAPPVITEDAGEDADEEGIITIEDFK